MVELIELNNIFFTEYLSAVSETIATFVISTSLYSIISQHNAHFRVHRTPMIL